MTQEEKQLLLKDLSARLPYGVIVEITSDGGMMEASYDMRLDAGLLADLLHSEDDFKPYLRPMSSMTVGEEEKFSEEMHKDFLLAKEAIIESDLKKSTSGFNKQDWLNANHFDYRGLIPMGLALEAPADMYGTA